MTDEEPDLVFDKNKREELLQMWRNIKKHKIIFKVIDIIGITFMVIALFKQNWFVAFLLFVMFFPDEIEIIRFFKRLFKSTYSSKNKEGK